MFATQPRRVARACHAVSSRLSTTVFAYGASLLQPQAAVFHPRRGEERRSPADVATIGFVLINRVSPQSRLAHGNESEVVVSAPRPLSSLFPTEGCRVGEQFAGRFGPSEEKEVVPTMSVQSTSGSIVEQFQNNADVEVDPENVEERVTTLIDEYQVPEAEARRSVVSHLLDEHEIDRDAFYDQSGSDGNDLVGCGKIEAPEQWVDLEAEVAQLWEPKSDSIAQVGLLADESGRIKFVSWAASDLPELEEGEAYALSNVVSDEYDGKFSVKLNKTTEIERLDEEIDTADGSESFTSEGALVALRPGSGLIKRCPEEDCSRVLNDGRCSEHGAVEGEFDMRIKAVLDNGHEVEPVIFDAEATEAVTGWSLDEATSAAMDALDTTIVAEEFQSQLVGRYFEIEGPEVGQYHLVDEVEESSQDVAFEADAARLLNERFDAEMA
jgi:replication factor A1